ncbi:MAG: hypothetical protein KAI80_06070, partial [Hyphomicrobiaceae bacterium]|nr:hypothetical protein [Hyphomicrobiaceae bacterium]
PATGIGRRDHKTRRGGGQGCTPLDYREARDLMLCIAVAALFIDVCFCDLSDALGVGRCSYQPIILAAVCNLNAN